MNPIDPQAVHLKDHVILIFLYYRVTVLSLYIGLPQTRLIPTIERMGIIPHLQHLVNGTGDIIRNLFFTLH